MNKKWKNDNISHYEAGLDIDETASGKDFETVLSQFEKICLIYKTKEETETILTRIRESKDKSMAKLKTFQVDSSHYSSGVEIVSDYRDRFEGVYLFFHERRALSAPLTEKELKADKIKKEKNKKAAEKRKATQIANLEAELAKLKKRKT